LQQKNFDCDRILSLSVFLLAGLVLAGCPSSTGSVYSPPVSDGYVIIDDVVETDGGVIGDGGAGKTPAIWQALAGPEGGNVGALDQDPYGQKDIYAATSRGIYLLSADRKSWSLYVAETKGVTAIAFTKERIFYCAEGLYYVDRKTNIRTAVEVHCNIVYANAEKVYVSAMEMIQQNALKLQVADATALEFKDIGFGAADLQQLFAPYVGKDEHAGISELVPQGNSILAVVAVGGNEAASQLFRSEDGGTSWKPVSFELPEKMMVGRLIPNPQSTRIYLVLERKDESPPPVLDVSQLVYRTDDGGKTWVGATELKSTGINQINDFEVVGTDIWIHHGMLTRFSKDGDSTNIEIPEYVGNLHFDARDTKIVYVMSGGSGLYVTDTTFTEYRWLVTGMVASPVSIIQTHPTDTNTLVTTGNNGFFPNVTRDGGKSWTSLRDFSWMGDEIAFDPLDTHRMIFADEQSNFVETNDYGKTKKRLAPGFSGSRILDFLVSHKGQGRLVASVSGVALTRLDEMDEILADPGSAEIGSELLADHWNPLDGSPDYAYALAAHPTDSDIFYSTNSPKKWQTSAGVWRYRHSTNELSELLTVEGAAGATSLVVDQNNAENIYAGVVGKKGLIYRSGDAGSTWDTINGALTFSTIHALAADPADAKVAYAAPWGGGLYKTDDGGSSWKMLSVPTPSVVGIIVDPKDNKHIIVGDRTEPTIYESTDAGVTWKTLVAVDKTDYYRVFSLTLHQGKVYFSVMKRMKGVLALFSDPMSGSTFRVENGKAIPLNDGSLSRVVIRFHSNGGSLYALSHISGLHRLNGQTWEDITANLPDLGYNDLMIDDQGTFHAMGGGDLDIALKPRVGDAKIINEIYLSSDGGKQYTGLLKTNPFGAAVKRLIQDKNTPAVFYAGTGNGVFVSTDRGKSWQPQNAGLSFKAVGSMAVVGDKLYLGTLGGGVFVGTISSDHTIVWATSNGPNPTIYNVKLKVHPTNGQTLYATAYPGGVFKTTNGGQTWQECNFAMPSFRVIDPAAQGYYNLEIDPNNPSVLYLAIFGKGVYKSTDGAASWRPMFGTFGQNVGIMKKPLTRILVDPKDSKTIYLGSGDGVYRSTDGAESWTEMPTQGLASKQVLSMRLDGKGRLYVGTDGYGIFRFDQEKGAWQHTGRATGMGRWQIWERRIYQFLSLRFHPTKKGRVYMGHFPAGFFVSDDGGASWKSSQLGLGNDGMFSLTLDPADPDTIWGGTYNGLVKSVDGGKTWADSSKGMPKEQWPFSVAIDETDTNILYVVTKNGQNKGFCDRNEFCGVVMKSIDGGKNWTKIMAGLSEMSEYYCLVIHPLKPKTLFVNGTTGVYVSHDAGATWNPLVDGLPTSFNPVRDNVAQNLILSTDKKSLYLGLHGFGAWRLDLAAF
jgi:photosystem II stability/assembly factor-like uncharacterized protein